ncbi:unnamed protein product [Cochlearia groenlandica]
MDDHNASIAEKCSTYRNTKLPNGTTKQITHTSGQIPFAGGMYDMVAPKKKGRIISMGFMHDVPLAPTSY